MPSAVQSIWEQEYAKPGLPSSQRAKPSNASPFVLHALRARGVPASARLLDIGCGSGRNAAYFANAGFEVHGIDFAAAAKRKFEDSVSRLTVERRPRFVLGRIDRILPFDTACFDAAICFTTLENLTDDAHIENFKRELARVLKPDGLFAVYFLTPDDEFYGPRVKKGPNGQKIVVAEDIGLTQRVFDGGEILRLFAPPFSLDCSRDFSFEDIRFGARYIRHLKAMVLMNSAGERASAEPVHRTVTLCRRNRENRHDADN